MLAALENGQHSADQRRHRRNHRAIQEDDTLILRVKPDNIKIQVARSAVSSVVTAGEG